MLVSSFVTFTFVKLKLHFVEKSMNRDFFSSTELQVLSVSVHKPSFPRLCVVLSSGRVWMETSVFQLTGGVTGMWTVQMAVTKQTVAP